MKEIKFEEMTLRQKLSFVHNATLNKDCKQADEDYVIELVKQRAIGSVWVQWSVLKPDLIRNRIKRIRETADYPILIITDAECGFGDYKIGHHNALGRVGGEEYSYAFGKKLGVMARELGYNVVCNPLLDVSFLGSNRSFGSDIHEVAKLAKAEARGMHDAEILTVGKHYPSSIRGAGGDTHLQESRCDQTVENLLATSLYAYNEMIKEDLLDGIMAGHEVMEKIDSTRPASLSKAVLNVIREHCGFEGFIISDALCMMGIRAKYGPLDPMGMCIEAGNDLANMYDPTGVERLQNALYDCYERGILSEEALNLAVKRILRAQHKVLELDAKRATAVTEEEEFLAQNIDADGVCACVDDGLPTAISKDGKHLFVIIADNEYLNPKAELGADTFSGNWHKPELLENKLRELFPNSNVIIIYQFPTQGQCIRVINGSFGYDEVVFITYSEFLAYTGAECYTNRFLNIVNSMQYTNRISTIVHYGNPMVMEALPHISRKIIGSCSTKSTLACLEILAGERDAKGKLTYDVRFK